MKQKTGASLLQKLKQYEEYGSQASGNEESYAQQMHVRIRIWKS